MSLPSELRALCFQLSSTPAADLPRLTPTLLRQVLHCQAPLSTPSENHAKADASSTSVLVHKLKTQLTTLLNGKSPEGRFAAVVLIKAVVEVGGWEVLQSSESWVRGLLSVLGKPDSAATKELCIIALTKIYFMTHQYQTLVREITTPTLPAFVTACLNLISAKPSGKSFDGPSSLTEVVFRSFATLIPRHTTIYRPFVSQIRNVSKPYLAPTSLDAFVPLSLKESARHLVVALHLTVAKNAGGEAWGKAARDLVKDIHVTADQVFRAVVEDWESTAGYVGARIDVDQELSGGGTAPEDLPQWTGIAAGVERVIGLLGVLAEYFKHETSTLVNIPLGVIIDLTTRLLSISIPSSTQTGPAYGETRLHPAIDRDERDRLWSGMPGIYVAALDLLVTISGRLQNSILPLAPTLLEQLAWVFPSGKHDPALRISTFKLLQHILKYAGHSWDRKQVSKLTLIIRSCCEESYPLLKTPLTGTLPTDHINANGKRPMNQNADSFISKPSPPQETFVGGTDIMDTANLLLPMFMSHMPQQYLDISLRALVERTAILSHNKEAMLASILNPFVGKNGKSIASVLPHLAREFDDDAIVEILLRPRLPMVPSMGFRVSEGSTFEDMDEQDTEMQQDTIEEYKAPSTHDAHLQVTASEPGLGLSSLATTTTKQELGGSFLRHSGLSLAPSRPPESLTADRIATLTSDILLEPPASSRIYEALTTQPHTHIESEEDSDDESVHLTMQLDTDSDTSV